jgi:hypothetical protein
MDMPAHQHSPRGAWQLLDHPARLFVCARCRAQVLLCSRCDRGQRYCGPACSRAARQESQREAARRYQVSRAGRMAHAERARRWRQRCRERERVCRSVAWDAAAANIVTHHGSLIRAVQRYRLDPNTHHLGFGVTAVQPRPDCAARRWPEFRLRLHRRR